MLSYWYQTCYLGKFYILAKKTKLMIKWEHDESMKSETCGRFHMQYNLVLV